MAETVLPKLDPQAFTNLMRAQGLALHAKDQPPATRPDWQTRRARLRQAMRDAAGYPQVDKPCPLEPKIVRTLARSGYRIELLLFQSLPNVWVTATAYVPEKTAGKLPAVLVVHGHWAWARRDPVVQARCLGLVKLGFFVLAVDAFGAGERYTTPGRGTYHGSLYGSTLWPTGRTLLAQQVYDNGRAVDYLRTRPEVDGDRLGITGASGGGNQSMYAGALDERFGAVVPVCSVGTYQAYLHTACCVCEVLPGGLRVAEEGDVLALVAPRALLVVNATKDAFQFSVGEAVKSVARARHVFRLYGAEEKLAHATFEAPHDYNQAMREAMYGWMTRWLKNEGDGKPIAEPKHEVEKPETLAVFPDEQRPKGFLYPPGLAAREGQALLEKFRDFKADHAEDWESTAVHMRARLRKEVFGDFPPPPRPAARAGKTQTADGVEQLPLILHPERDMPLPVLYRRKLGAEALPPVAVLLHLDGKAEALKHPLAKALVNKGWTVLAPDLRATGETKPEQDAIAGAPDHNSAEHALWLGRPLLGQWVFDVQCLLDWVGIQAGLDRRRVALVGIGPAGIVALCAGGLLEDRVASVAAVDAPTSYVTDQPYPAGTRMGLLAPGILRVGDVPQLAALVAPRRLMIVGGLSSQGRALTEKQLREALAFPARIYQLYKAGARLTVAETLRPEDVAAAL
jgi:dienelactone hydrolase